MNDVKRALLGDHEAAKRLTDAGALLPCPFCGGEVYENQWVDCKYESIRVVMQCKRCTVQTPISVSVRRARLAWNTRAPILSAEVMEMLEVIKMEVEMVMKRMEVLNDAD